ncbi:isocitrate dehydrogenase [NAD] subunit gamma, mitochondrial-like [Nilaparvata lugens]|uniref:isocitrate dehydrogenase [NAD] subunit gamma, mitochondrial-like n=1 Tax=Nilaparvata lugens TaxID=108931 RepID=UPI00193DCC78|nr:isocitrate dehydrogenase [NAD] subunit gamma, mitochondrial-like [Nilaparvata lugens]
MTNYLKYLAHLSKRNLLQNLERPNFLLSSTLGTFPVPKEVIYNPYFRNTVAGSEPRSKYGGKYFVTLVPGAGIGRELADALSSLFYSANIPIQFDRIEISAKSDEEDYKQMLRSIRHCGAAIKGYIEPQVKDDNEPSTSHIRSRNLRLRSTLDLYVEVMHFKSHPALSHLVKYNLLNFNEGGDSR